MHKYAAGESLLAGDGSAEPPAPFTTEDFARRMERAAGQAGAAGLTGILVAPGPDLLYFTGYQPIAITERITLLALHASRDARDDRPDSRAPGRRGLSRRGRPVARRLEGRQRPVRGNG